MRFVFCVFVVIFTFFPSFIYSQEGSDVAISPLNSEVYVEGPLTLLGEKHGKVYQFYLKKEGEITPLVNTKRDGKHQEEYKDVLKANTEGTAISVSNVKLTPRSLASFFIKYNSLVDSEFDKARKASNLSLRLGFFGGIDNAIYSNNTANALHPIAGIDLEFADPNLRHHSMLLQAKQTFTTSDHDYKQSQLSFNYRFKLPLSDRLDTFINLRFAAVYHTTETYDEYDTEKEAYITISNSGSGIGAPLSFGLGADYRVGNGFFTLGINDVIGLNVNSNKEFPVHLSLGYKWLL